MSQIFERRSLLPAAGMILALLAAGALATSCSKKEASGGAGDKVLAKVDGSAIYQSDVNTAKSLLPAQYQQLPETILVPALLDQLIDARIAANAAEKAGFDKDPNVKREIQQSRENVLQGAYLRQLADKDLSDAAVREEYQRQVANFVPQAEIHARHILVPDEAGIKLAAQRVADGEAFESVAAEMSQDQGSAEHGGDLGYFTRDKMVKEFGDVAFAMKPGQVSAPFKTQYGWHIVKVEDVRQTSAPPFEQVQAALREQMLQKVTRQKLDELVKAAKVERFDDSGHVQAPQAAPESTPQAPIAAPETTPATPAPQSAPSATPAPAPTTPPVSAPSADVPPAPASNAPASTPPQ